ncbi:dehydrogenase [Planctomycetota bacterium]|nr:dehydrogenase [Planctomycetota bacterium]
MTIRIAALSAWHVHADEYARQVNRHAGAQIAVVWDDDAARGRSWAEKLGVPFVAELGQILADPSIDGVLVCSSTRSHPEVMVAAASAGKHIFTEKVLAITLAEAERIAAAVRTAGVRFAISMPHRCNANNRYAHQAIARGLLGRLASFRFRNSHNGATGGWLPAHFLDPVPSGGGAMIDLGCHGMYLAAWLFGMPERVTSVFTKRSGVAVDDLGISVLGYADGRIASNETGFVTFATPCSLELAGDLGCLVIGGPDQSVRLRSKQLDDGGKGWHTITDLPPALPHPVDQWLDAIAGTGTIHFGLSEALELSALMDAAYASWRSGAGAVVQLVRR